MQGIVGGKLKLKGIDKKCVPVSVVGRQLSGTDAAALPAAAACLPLPCLPAAAATAAAATAAAAAETRRRSRRYRVQEEKEEAQEGEGAWRWGCHGRRSRHARSAAHHRAGVRDAADVRYLGDGQGHEVHRGGARRGHNYRDQREHAGRGDASGHDGARPYRHGAQRAVRVGCGDELGLYGDEYAAV
eukprot:COSAG06_NODE_2095_length_7603_cov_10.942093_2_plen_187_part_00